MQAIDGSEGKDSLVSEEIIPAQTKDEQQEVAVQGGIMCQAINCQWLPPVSAGCVATSGQQ